MKIVKIDMDKKEIEVEFDPREQDEIASRVAAEFPFPGIDRSFWENELGYVV